MVFLLGDQYLFIEPKGNLDTLEIVKGLQTTIALVEGFARSASKLGKEVSVMALTKWASHFLGLACYRAFVS